MPTVSFETLGCKLNQYETDSIAARFRDLGWEIVDPSQFSDAAVVNTCTVTNKADRKSRNILGHQIRQGAERIVVVTGCFAESGQGFLEALPGVTFLVPNRQKNQIAALVDAHYRGEIAADLPAPDPFGFETHDRVFHTRASLKIQDGCDNFCSFCIIPQVRGRAVSRPKQAILEAAHELILAGRKEIVLTGVNMGRWAEGKANFVDLVRALLDLPGDFRLRITSLEPENLGAPFAELFSHPKMCPHVHLCLQSGSPRVLLAMRREYQREDFLRLVDQIRLVRPDVNLTTDLIAGFPGETSDEWDQSLSTIQEVDFGHVHVFPYSRRKDTRADRMPDQIAEQEKQIRARTAQKLVLGLREAKMVSQIGKERTLLVETRDGSKNQSTTSRGLTEDYFPLVVDEPLAWNTFVRVKITGVVSLDGEPTWTGKRVER